jgi:AmpE protein
VLIYTFGPHDLDTDIDSIIHADDDQAQAEALEALLGAEPPGEGKDREAHAVEFVFRESLQRWFGTIFWFAILGIYGALVYRLADRLTEGDLKLEPEQYGLFMRLRQILDWPVAQLMTLALAIATDFDSVYRTWKQYHDTQHQDPFAGNNAFLLMSAREIVLAGRAARDGYADQLDGPLASLKQAMDLVWRILGVWLTVLALLLLVNVIA